VKILVIGDSCTDKFIYGTCDRICPEAPVPVFAPTKVKTNGGMALNVQSNVQAFGVDCDIITNGELITKTRYVDSKTNQMLLRVDEHDYVKTKVDIEDVRNRINGYDGVIISDYNKGFLSEEDIDVITTECKNVFLNTKKKFSWNFVDARFIQLNQYEYENTLREIDDMRDDIYDKLIVTYGDRGCYYQKELYPPPHKVGVRDLSGAGDTFISAFAVNFIENNDVYKAIDFAQDCASKVVAKRGVVTI
jgi:D-beta-D-heptose 7-phosphate kinase/D-beta-D-heptose 1-phosphate adenosyltransferase